ncbi:MAG: HAMP domain-containing protein [Hydrogenimonas sp.]|nr:HAMP domain-containing protein [Hydrogenimonas sp.]
MSVRTKLLAALITVVVAGYLVIVFKLSDSETKILEKRAISHLQNEAEYSVKYIRNVLNSLSEEVEFLTSLEVMDDLIADDIDKRIELLLQKKRSILNKDVSLVAVNPKGDIVAKASDKLFILDSDAMKRVIDSQSQKEIFNEFLLFKAPVYASFDKTLQIGQLLMFMPLKQLEKELRESSDLKAWIIPPQKNSRLSSLFRSLENKSKDRYIYVTKEIGPPLEGWMLGYAVEKSIAYQTIKEVQDLLLIAFTVMLLLIVALTLLVDKELIEPIRKLAKTSSKIVDTNDYSIRVEHKSKDEIGELYKSFNMLMKKTSKAFEAVQKSNKEYADALNGVMNLVRR